MSGNQYTQSLAQVNASQCLVEGFYKFSIFDSRFDILLLLKMISLDVLYSIHLHIPSLIPSDVYAPINTSQINKYILEFDSTFEEALQHNSLFAKKKDISGRITSKKAVIYARDILVACNRTRSGGNSYYCVDHLCINSQFMFLRLYSSEAEPFFYHCLSCHIIQ